MDHSPYFLQNGQKIGPSNSTKIFYCTDFTILQKFHFKKVLEIALLVNVDWVNLKKIENQFANANPIFYNEHVE